MGHAPSSECCNNEPFVVDFESKGKGHERLAAIALTKENLPSINTPFFQGLYAARCDESVRHWYCSSADRSQIDAAPTAESVYQSLIREASEYVAATEEKDPKDFKPLPIALIKLPHDAVLYHPEDGQLLTTLELLGTNPSFEVVGYFGCRHFSAGGQVSPAGAIGMFLSKTFNNEAKSVAILEIACRCYKHYMNMYGLVDTPWPAEIQFETLDSNMPQLRLMQKLLVSSQQQQLANEGPEFSVVHDEEANLLRLVAKGSIVACFAEHLAAQVTTTDSITFSLRTRPVEPSPVTVVQPKLDEVILSAKKKWSDANRPVVEAYTSAKLLKKNSPQSQQQETSAVPSSRTVTATSGPFPTAPTPLLSSSPATSTPTTVSNAPSSYRHSVYDVQVLDAQFTTQTAAVDQTAVYQQYEEPGQEVVEMQEEPQEQHHNYSNSAYDQIPNYDAGYSQHEVEEVSALFLAKRTPINFWKKGSWTSCQWRDEAVVKLCPVQHAENDGLLAVELMYPNPNTPCPEICVFDEFNRPAKVRLDKPSIFYVPTNSLYHRDIHTKKYIPFTVGAEVATQAHQQSNSYQSYEYNSHNIYQQEQRHASY